MSSDWLREYPKEWPTISRKILARDRFRCQHCQLKQFSVIHRKESGGFILWGVTRDYREGREVVKLATRHTGKRHILIVLACCHVSNPDPFDVRECNLKTFCQLCHHLVDREMRSDNRRATWKKKRGETEAERPTVKDMFEDEEEYADDYEHEFLHRG